MFKYKKFNEKYWNSFKLYKQVVTKAIPIVEVLYLKYSLLFLFDNTTNYSVYTNNTLCIIGIN